MAAKKVEATIESALKNLVKERAVVDDTIAKLRALLSTTANDTAAEPKRRGRPPKAEKLKPGPKPGRKAGRKPGRPARAAATADAAETSPRSSWSNAARRKAADRMRAYWAERRKEKASAGKAPTKRQSRA